MLSESEAGLKLINQIADEECLIKDSPKQQ